LPVLDDVVGGASVLRLDTTPAQRVLDVFRGADPERVAPDNTVVLVQNGTPVSGRAGEAAAALRDLDFVVPSDNVGDAESFDVEQTAVYYLEGQEERAELVARALAVDPIVDFGLYIVGADVSVVIGADWPGIGTELREPTPGLVPTTSTTVPRSTTTTPAGRSTTTTSIIGSVPTTPPGAAC
jgi:hypothetical protein